MNVEVGQVIDLTHGVVRRIRKKMTNGQKVGFFLDFPVLGQFSDLSVVGLGENVHEYLPFDGSDARWAADRNYESRLTHGPLCIWSSVDLYIGAAKTCFPEFLEQSRSMGPTFRVTVDGF